MPRMFQAPAAPTESNLARMGSWLPPVPADDDLALGWECANPALQIERWGQDLTAADTSALN